jgi:hypothetical protein
LTAREIHSILAYRGSAGSVFGQLIRHRGETFRSPRHAGPAGPTQEESLDDQDAGRDEDILGQSPRRGGVPIGLQRFKANAEAWRGRLERELRVSPQTSGDRERIVRWLNNLNGRETWLAARLEHTIATKRLLAEALKRDKSAGVSRSRQPIEEVKPDDDGEKP